MDGKEGKEKDGMDGKDGKEEKDGREVQQAAGVRFAAALPQLMSVAGEESAAAVNVRRWRGKRCRGMVFIAGICA